jgi:cation-transporting ATPase 13A2
MFLKSQCCHAGGPGVANAEVEWASVDDDKLRLDPYTLKPVILQHNLGYDTNESEVPDYQLALTGDVFRWMLEFAPLDTMQRVGVRVFRSRKLYLLDMSYRCW